jgi:HK97 family phage portal protein
MGTTLDILRGKVAVGPTAAPFATQERAVVTGGSSSAGGYAVSVGAGLGSILNVPGARSWELNVAAGRCIDTISSNLASVDLVVMAGDEANDQHPIAQLWNTSQPGAPVSARITRQSLFAQAEVRGEGFGYIDRGPTGTGPARGLWPIYDEVDVVIEGSEADPMHQSVRGFVVRRNGKRFGLLPSEVLWLRYPHPTKAWCALAPWARALGAAELDSYARAWQLGEFKNGAKPGAVVYLGDLDEPAYNRAVADFRTGVEGAQNAGKSLLVAGQVPATVSRLSLSAAEMDYLKSRAANDDEVFLAFGIRPDYFKGQSTYENQRAAKTALWSDNHLPKLDVLGSEIDRQLLPAQNEQAAFDVTKVDALQENADAIYNRIRGIAYTDTLTVDEARAQLGLDPLPGGEGAYTLTEYRARIALRNLPPTDGQPVRDARPQVVTSLLPRQRRILAVGGHVRVVALDTRKGKRKAVKRPSTSNFYDTHERVGQRTMAALAEKQLRVVLRSLSKLRTSEVAGWAEHARGCGFLTIGTDGGILGRMVAAPATSGRMIPAHAMRMLNRDENLHTDLGLSPWSNLSPTVPCDCARIAADSVFDAGYWRGQTEDATEAWLRGVWEGAGAQMADGLGVSFDVFDDRVTKAMDKRRTVLADQVTQTTRRVLDSALLEVIAEEGWSIDDAERAIRGVFDDLSGYRANTIARTEVVGGYNAASNIAAQASGLVSAREWLTAEDERVRRSHQAINGQRLTDPKDTYRNGLRFPGDPQGDPSETVNCRCVELYDV